MFSKTGLHLMWCRPVFDFYLFADIIKKIKENIDNSTKVWYSKMRIAENFGNSKKINVVLGGITLVGDSFERFAQMLSTASKSILRLKSKCMSKYGLSSTHTLCLRSLYENSEGMTKSEISDFCDIDKAQITRIMGELIDNEYVRADMSGRTYNRKFLLTEKGLRITEEINETVALIVKYVNEDIPKEDIEHFYSVFETINTKLKSSEEYFKKGF